MSLGECEAGASIANSPPLQVQGMELKTVECHCAFKKTAKYVNPLHDMLFAHVAADIPCVTSMPPGHAKKGAVIRYYTNPLFVDSSEESSMLFED